VSADPRLTPKPGAGSEAPLKESRRRRPGSRPRGTGRTRARFHRMRTVFGRAVARNRILLLLAVIGPGIITSNVDNDPGGITTYSVAGSHYGYGLLWMMIPVLIALVVIQEMCVRMAIVTGKGLADLIRENFGIKMTFYILVALLFTNMFNTMSEFAGVAAGAELLGVTRYIMVPIGAVAIAVLILRGSYRIVERVFLVASLIYVTYIISAFLAKPDWGQIAKATVVPHVEPSTGFLLLAIGLVGTTIAPWMQFYIQASTVEKSVKKEELGYARVDVTVGSVMAVIVAAFIIITCGATLFKEGIRVDSAAAAARALQPLAGKYAEELFAFGLLAAGLFSSGILPLSTSYHVCEGLGWPAGLNHRVGEAKQFYVLYATILAVGAIPILIPGIPLLKVMLISQICNGVLLPFVLLMMLHMVNDKSLMGEHTNGWILNIIAYLTVILLILMTLGSIVLTFVAA
jgi:NRAMP (natural resistance-associated macrophage protein)-like metal ion transporter